MAFCLDSSVFYVLYLCQFIIQGSGERMYTVLLADDEKSILDALCDTIAWQQFGVDQVLRASDGRQALSIIRQQKVDLLITDILMPQMDGLTLIRILRREFPRLHCILLSGHGEFQYVG